MGWHPVEDDRNLSRSAFEMASAGISMPQDSLELCPLCNQQRRTTRLIFCRISLDMALLCCPETECVYPFNLERWQFELHFLTVEFGEGLEDADMIGTEVNADGSREVELSRRLNEEIHSRCLPIGGGIVDSFDAFHNRLHENMKELKRRLDSYLIFYPVINAPSRPGDSGAAPQIDFCPECAKRGVQSELILARVTQTRGLLICPIGECPYPLDQTPEALSQLCVRTGILSTDLPGLERIAFAVHSLSEFIEQTLASESPSAGGRDSETSDTGAPTELEGSATGEDESMKLATTTGSESCPPLPIESSNPVSIPVDGEPVVQHEGDDDAAAAMEVEEFESILSQDASGHTAWVDRQQPVTEGGRSESSASSPANDEKLGGDGEERPAESEGEIAPVSFEGEDLVVGFDQDGFLVDIRSRDIVSAGLQLEIVDSALTASSSENAIDLPTEEKANMVVPIENEGQMSMPVESDIASDQSGSCGLPEEGIPAIASMEGEVIELGAGEQKGVLVGNESGVVNAAVSVGAAYPLTTAVGTSAECTASVKGGEVCDLRAHESETRERKPTKPERRARRRVKTEDLLMTVPESDIDAHSRRSHRARRAPSRFNDYLVEDSLQCSPEKAEDAYDYVVEKSSEVANRGKSDSNYSSAANSRRKPVGHPKRTLQKRKAKPRTEEDDFVTTREPPQGGSFNGTETTVTNGELNVVKSKKRNARGLVKAFREGGPFRVNASAWRPEAGAPENDLISSSPRYPSKNVSKEEDIPGRPPDKISRVSGDAGLDGRDDLKESRETAQNSLTSEVTINGVQKIASPKQPKAPPKPSFFARIKKRLMNACTDVQANQRSSQANIRGEAATSHLEREMFGRAETPSLNFLEAETSEALQSSLLGNSSAERQPMETSVQVSDEQLPFMDTNGGLLDFGDLDFALFDEVGPLPVPAVVDDEPII